MDNIISALLIVAISGEIIIFLQIIKNQRRQLSRIARMFEKKKNRSEERMRLQTNEEWRKLYKIRATTWQEALEIIGREVGDKNEI